MCLCAQVIEVFIRSEEGLSRDMVKHLNSIEEQVLESRAWTADSALWRALQAAGNKVPTVEEVRGTHIIHNTDKNLQTVWKYKLSQGDLHSLSLKAQIEILINIKCLKSLIFHHKEHQSHKHDTGDDGMRTMSLRGR